jgi:hypothetical protein
MPQIADYIPLVDGRFELFATGDGISGAIIDGALRTDLNWVVAGDAALKCKIQLCGHGTYAFDDGETHTLQGEALVFAHQPPDSRKREIIPRDVRERIWRTRRFFPSSHAPSASTGPSSPSARTMPKRSHREASVLYGIFGGTPRYMAPIHPTDTIADRVMESMLSPRGDVHTQLANLIEQEKGVSATPPSIAAYGRCTGDKLS